MTRSTPLWTATEIARRIRAREISALEVVNLHLARIERLNPALNAIVTLDVAAAVVRAREADAALDRGEIWGPLHGVPYTLKDHHPTAGVRTSLGLRGSERVPDRDGIVSERLRAAGAILLGKTNMALSVQTNSELFGRTSNPYDLGRGVGGSSGGAAAAVASGMSAFDVGSDASGSIRLPAHFCGVFGLKTTLHRLPLVELGLDAPGTPRADRLLGVYGPIARSAEDLELVMRALVGTHPEDPECPPVPFARVTAVDPGALRIAAFPTLEGVPNQREQHDALERTARALRDAGARVETPALPVPFAELLSASRRYYPILMDGLAEAGFSPPAALPDLGSPSLGSLRAVLGERDRLAARFERFFEHYDAILCPTAIRTAFPHSPPRAPVDVDGVSVPSLYVDHPCLLSNYLGLPALTLPVALDSLGLPIGAQLVGARWRDAELIGVATALSRICGPIPPPVLRLGPGPQPTT